MSGRCDQFEILISSWMDDELSRLETTEMIDHLVRCKACREAYRQARALEGALLADGRIPANAAAAVPKSGWERIEQRASQERTRQSSPWLLRAAAVAFVGLALALTVVPRIDDGSRVATARSLGGEIEVELGSRSGEMTEERFLEIATEVLESDRRYQRAMLKVMDSVIDTVPATEGGDDLLLVAPRESERAEENTGGRA